MTRLLRALLLLPLSLLGASTASAEDPEAPEAPEAKVPVEVLELENGMRFLLVQRENMTTISAGWVAHVGSANERPGITGLSHLFEHMMFKGSHAIGTRDIQRDLEILEEQEALQEEIRQIYREQRARWRRGEIDDPYAEELRSEHQIELEQRFQALVDEQRELMVKDEFDKIYTKAGATGMNAGTTQDITIYFITVPANKLELWCWMESDRLHTPVMREFYSERDVVYEERRLRTESTPTGEFDEQFDAMFWQSHPYGWPVVGWPSDLRVITKEQADEYYDTYYAPNNLTGALVGNFELQEAKQLIQQHFGRLERGAQSPPDVVTLEMEQKAEKRMVAECDCQPQIAVRYHTVPFMHRDSYALDVLAGLMNGRTGRLYKAMVLDQEIASTTTCGQDSAKYAGSFSFSAQTKGEGTPEALEQAWYAELQRLIDEPIPERELTKVKNRIAADAFRQLESPFFLLIQLLFYDGLGDWNYINTWADITLAVTAEDVKRVASEYLTLENRAVALYYRQDGPVAEIPAEFAGLAPDQLQMVQAQVTELEKIEDPGQLEEILAGMSAQKDAVPEEFKGVVTALETWVHNRITELKDANAEAIPASAPAEGGQQ